MDLRTKEEIEEEVLDEFVEGFRDLLGDQAFDNMRLSIKEEVRDRVCNTYWFQAQVLNRALLQLRGTIVEKVLESVGFGRIRN